jgi:DNA-binding XRE family transcriptional regulator
MGLSQEDAAALLGVHPKTFQRWEVGAMAPTLARCLEILKTLEELAREREKERLNG